MISSGNRHACIATSVELAAPSARWVDLQPVVFDDEGRGWQANTDGLPPFRYRGWRRVNPGIAHSTLSLIESCRNRDVPLRVHAVLQLRRSGVGGQPARDRVAG